MGRTRAIYGLARGIELRAVGGYLKSSQLNNVVQLVNYTPHAQDD